MRKKAIILLSGGLDSLCALDIAKKTYDIPLALNFNYNQKAFIEENKAASEIAAYYNINFETIELSFLAKILDNALVNYNDNNLDNFSSVWVPNRNGLFINIAACYCDKYDIDYIIFGANKEEAQSFVDNSKSFIKYADIFFNYSTQVHCSVIAPCLEMDKKDMVNYTIDNNLPLKLIKSCYNSSLLTNKKHCGECLSCKLLYNAIKNSKKPGLIEEIFNE